jgi:hypothetical protein
MSVRESISPLWLLEELKNFHEICIYQNATFVLHNVTSSVLPIWRSFELITREEQQRQVVEVPEIL